MKPGPLQTMEHLKWTLVTLSHQYRRARDDIRKQDEGNPIDSGKFDPYKIISISPDHIHAVSSQYNGTLLSITSFNQKTKNVGCL